MFSLKKTVFATRFFFSGGVGGGGSEFFLPPSRAPFLRELEENVESQDEEEE